MHELSYVLDIIDSVNTTFEKSNAKKINKVYVDVGEMSGVVPYYLDKYYKDSIKGTNLEGSELIITEKEVRFQCLDCGTEYHPTSEYEYACPKCTSRKGKLLQGKGIQIEKIEIED